MVVSTMIKRCKKKGPKNDERPQDVMQAIIMYDML